MLATLQNHTNHRNFFDCRSFQWHYTMEVLRGNQAERHIILLSKRVFESRYLQKIEPVFFQFFQNVLQLAQVHPAGALLFSRVQVEYQFRKLLMQVHNFAG